MPKVAAVLGGGMQGCCVALMLSKLGFQVKLYDKSTALMRRASANQEGKIHLGFVYARDQKMVTARTMIEHAMQFAPALESLIGPIDWEPHLSERFYCGIHGDSSITLDAHFRHFKALQEIYEEVLDDAHCHYLGRRPQRIWREDTPLCFVGKSLVNAVYTEESAVHPGWMRNIIINAIKSNPDITTFLQHGIADVENANASFRIHGNNQNGRWKHTADIVVNCLWEGKQSIDRALGFEYSEDWITRVKYGFMLDATPPLHALPSLTLTHGPFGDIVNYPYDKSIYINWYPSCMTYLGNHDQLPAEWEEVCEGKHSPELVQRILQESKMALSEYVPELRDLKLKQVMAGAIMGQGKTDISDRESGLHRRHGIGVVEYDNYYSIFTGKFTSAPANAMQLQKILT